MAQHSSHLRLPVLPLFCTVPHLFLVHPLNGMFHLSWKPGQGGRAESEEKLSVQEKPSFWSLASLGSDTAADDKWRKWHKGNSRGRPLEDETELASGPLPVACGWSKLEMDRTGNRHLMPLRLLEDPSLRRHRGTPTGWGEK